MRSYTLHIKVEVREQDDLEHFQPDTVTATAPELGVSWVSGNDREALHDFFRFFVRQEEIPAGMSITEYAASPQAAKIRADIEHIADSAFSVAPWPRE